MPTEERPTEAERMLERAQMIETIRRAAEYLETTDRETVLKLLAATPYSDHVKQNPAELIADLRSVQQDPSQFFRFTFWAIATTVLQLAGLDADHSQVRPMGVIHQQLAERMAASVEPPVDLEVHGHSEITPPAAPRIDFEDERFIEPQYLEAHRARQLPIDCPFGEHTGIVVATSTDVNWIDEGLAELVYHMWKAGIRTTESCQDLYGDGKRAYLGFEQPQDLELWLSLVVPQDDVPGGLWDRATGCNLATKTPKSYMWEYSMHPQIEGRRVRMSLFVEFPPKDIAELTRRMQASSPPRPCVGGCNGPWITDPAAGITRCQRCGTTMMG